MEHLLIYTTQNYWSSQITNVLLEHDRVVLISSETNENLNKLVSIVRTNLRGFPKFVSDISLRFSKRASYSPTAEQIVIFHQQALS